jgi:hypothetical protein
MKRLFAIVIATLFSLTRCTAEAQFTDFDHYETDFTAVAGFLNDYYASQRFNDRITVGFKAGAMCLYIDPTGGMAQTALPADNLFNAVTTVEEQGFTYAWVTADYIIFWEDETHYYGILHSQTPQNAISEIRSWYKGMEYAKISSEWYEIGILNSI